MRDNNNSPTVSVVTACRNARTEMDGCAASVLSALGPTDEWIVQDGNSTDGTPEWLASLRDTRVKWECRPDAGPYDAMNRAVARLSGSFIWFIGADDRVTVAIDGVRPKLRDAATVYYGDVRLKSNHSTYGGAFTASRLARANICHQAILYPRAAFAHRAFDSTYPIQADWEFNMACRRNPSLRFEYIGVCMAVFNNATGLSSRFVDIAFQRDYTKLLLRYFPLAACWKPLLIHTASRWARQLAGRPLKRERRVSGLTSHE